MTTTTETGGAAADEFEHGDRDGAGRAGATGGGERATSPDGAPYGGVQDWDGERWTGRYGQYGAPGVGAVPGRGAPGTPSPLPPPGYEAAWGVEPLQVNDDGEYVLDDEYYRLTKRIALGAVISALLAVFVPPLAYAVYVGVAASSIIMYDDLRYLHAHGAWEGTPLTWAIGAVLLWIVVMPLYVYRRRKIPRVR